MACRVVLPATAAAADEKEKQVVKALNLFVGSYNAVLDFAIFKGEGFTHVVNCAPNSCANVHKDCAEYHVLPIDDYDSVDIKQYFEVASTWIHGALAEKDNVVLVHCSAGMSRSVSIVLAYLIRYHDLDYDTALAAVRKTRPIACPNRGFEKQLREWYSELQAAKNTV